MREWSINSERGAASTPTRTLTLAVLALALASCNAEKPNPSANPQETSNSSCSTVVIRQPALDGVFEVSLIALIATPERYANARVRVRGYAVFEYEGDALYLHREDYEQVMTKNRVSLYLPESTTKRIPRDPAYSVVEGRFDPTRHGHMAGSSGAIVEVSLVEEVPSREQIRRILGLDASE